MSESIAGTGRRLDVDPGRAQELTTLELLFDLVFVFALPQLSGYLSNNLTWRGTLETVVLLLAVFCVWSFTVYDSTTVLVRSRKTYPIVVALLLASLVMNVAISQAFEGSGWMFVISMLAIQFSRTFVARRVDVYEELRRHRTAVAIWFCFSSLFWIAGCAADKDQRLWLWLVAALVDLAGRLTWHPLPRFGRPGLSRLPFDFAHQVRRCRLFFIICLAASFLAVGNSMKLHIAHSVSLLAGLLSLTVIVGLWYIFFWRTAIIDGLISGDSPLFSGPVSADSVRPSPSNDARLGVLITEGQQLLVAGLVIFTVGMQAVVEAPRERIPALVGLLLGWGPALCLIALWLLFIKKKVRPEGLNFACLTMLGIGVLLALLRPAAFIAIVEIAIVVICACLVYGNGVGKMRPFEEGATQDAVDDAGGSLGLSDWSDPKAIRLKDRDFKNKGSKAADMPREAAGVVADSADRQQNAPDTPREKTVDEGPKAAGASRELMHRGRDTPNESRDVNARRQNSRLIGVDSADGVQHHANDDVTRQVSGNSDGEGRLTAGADPMGTGHRLMSDSAIAPPSYRWTGGGGIQANRQRVSDQVRRQGRSWEGESNPPSHPGERSGI